MSPMQPLLNMMRSGRLTKLPSHLRWLPLLFAFTAVAGSGVGSDPEAYKLLEKMWQASHQLNYEGTFAYLNNDQIETMHLTHTANGGQEQERLISLNGVQREVVRDNHSVVYIMPDNQLVAAKLRSESDGSLSNAKDLSQFYQLQIRQDDRVAGRQANVILIMPLDNYRYGHRMFLDAEHGLALKSEVLDGRGESVSQIMFTQLHVDPEITIDRQDDSANDMASRSNFSWVNQVPARRLNAKNSAMQVSPWIFSMLPEGFRLTVHTRRPTTKGRDRVDHFIFSDGLASLSVYIERMGAKKGLIGASKMGAINVYGRRIDEHQVTVVGEVPERTVRELAQGVVANRVGAGR